MRNSLNSLGLENRCDSDVWLLEQLRAAVVEVGLVGPFPSGLSHWPSVYIGSINHGVMRSIVELFRD